MSKYFDSVNYTISLVDTGKPESPEIASEDYVGTPEQVADYLESLCACYADIAIEIGGTAIPDDDTYPSFALIEGEITEIEDTTSLDIPDFDDNGLVENADDNDGEGDYTVFTLD